MERHPNIIVDTVRLLVYYCAVPTFIGQCTTFVVSSTGYFFRRYLWHIRFRGNLVERVGLKNCLGSGVVSQLLSYPNLEDQIWCQYCDVGRDKADRVAYLVSRWLSQPATLAALAS